MIAWALSVFTSRRNPDPEYLSPAPAPAPLDAMARFRACRSYEQYALDAKSASVSDARLIEEAACLCSLAGSYTVRLPADGIQRYRGIAVCPGGTTPMPMGRDAKQWKGEWIDEPGHGACICSTDVREFRPAMIDK